MESLNKGIELGSIIRSVQKYANNNNLKSNFVTNFMENYSNLDKLELFNNTNNTNNTNNNPNGNYISVNQVLILDNSLISLNEKFIAKVTSFGNFEIHNSSGKRLWSTNTNKPSGKYFATMNNDGIFGIFEGVNKTDSDKDPISKIGKKSAIGKYFAVIQNDGNFVIYKGLNPSNNNEKIWSTFDNPGGNIINKDITTCPEDMSFPQERNNVWNCYDKTANKMCSYNGDNPVPYGSKKWGNQYSNCVKVSQVNSNIDELNNNLNNSNNNIISDISTQQILNNRYNEIQNEIEIQENRNKRLMNELGDKKEIILTRDKMIQLSQDKNTYKLKLINAYISMILVIILSLLLTYYLLK